MSGGFASDVRIKTQQEGRVSERVTSFSPACWAAPNGPRRLRGIWLRCGDSCASCSSCSVRGGSGRVREEKRTKERLNEGLLQAEERPGLGCCGCLLVIHRVGGVSRTSDTRTQTARWMVNLTVGLRFWGAIGLDSSFSTLFSISLRL